MDGVDGILFEKDIDRLDAQLPCMLARSQQLGA